MFLSHTSMFLSLSFSLPSPLSKNNKLNQRGTMSTPVFILVTENIQKEFDFQYLFLVMKLIVLNFLNLFKNSVKEENYN